jgi:orotidine-5'-phosphate decarboxylase
MAAAAERGEPFADRFAAARRRYGPLTFGLDPSGDLLDEWGLGDTVDGLERFVDIVVAAATDRVAVVKPQSAFYERHGWAGSRVLARLVDECRSAGLLVLLDAKRGDVGSTNDAYAEAYLRPGDGLFVDALTITPYLGFAAMGRFFDLAAEAGSGIFVVTRSSNPEGRALQQAVRADGRTVEAAMVEAIAAENERLALGTIGPVGAVFAPTHDAPNDIDLRAMNGLILAPGLGAQGATVDDLVRLYPTCADRVLPSASRSLLRAGPDVAALGDAVSSLAAEVRDALDAISA